MSKDLKDKAIKVKGGAEYVMVKDRITYFNENYKGNIYTDIVGEPGGDNPLFIVRARVEYEGEDGKMFARTGLSQARLGGAGANKEAALENAETSAIGRALAFMGIGVIDSIASADEMTKAGVDVFNI